MNDILMQDDKRDLGGDPSLSIIVPAHDAAADLALCLDAIRASEIGSDYELVVVDDASTDETAAIGARFADRVVRIEPPARGPAFARNEGVRNSHGRSIVFVDADVAVHSDAIGGMMRALRTEAAGAVCGSYDDRPAAPGIVSQYRNLLHYIVHQRSGGRVESFWAGCGAVDRTAFNAVGGFDSGRFHNPEMEDVELGYRLIDAGYSIMLDPLIQCTHRKKITLTSMMKSDFIRRGVPWARVLLDRGEFLKPRGLSLSVWERLSAFAAMVFALSLLAALILGGLPLVIIAVASLACFAAANAGLFRQLIRLRGSAFALASIPLHLIYNITAVTALIWALVSRPFTRSAQERYTHPR